ncbi:uncharacterized protein LOC106175811 [Lingula anatina]|uniref:Uncharacterized protein LOC106175811 n=1 Tax=Lingula anatina TaxID=7574 RepID=A0A1S3JST9_LINAN|nr:uncharacterized protein LOC106175811 [Lingula anatina]|eukprot:XP_013413418.1 uncharacterized protein LOC106175811 [Lingula anatina]
MQSSEDHSRMEKEGHNFSESGKNNQVHATANENDKENLCPGSVTRNVSHTAETELFAEMVADITTMSLNSEQNTAWDGIQTGKNENEQEFTLAEKSLQLLLLQQYQDLLESMIKQQQQLAIVEEQLMWIMQNK